MIILPVLVLFNLIESIRMVNISFIDNVIYNPQTNGSSNIVVLANKSCHECLCQYFSDPLLMNDSLILNCHVGNFCTFYDQFSLNYKIDPSVGERIYFLKNIFPTERRCCMPNITEVLDLLKRTTPVILNFGVSIAAIAYDTTRPNETAVIGWNAYRIFWFEPTFMTSIRNFSAFTNLNLMAHRGLIYTAVDSVPTIYVVNSQTYNQITSYTDVTLTRVRRAIFLNNSTTMIVTAQFSMSLSLFEKSFGLAYTFTVG